MAFPVTITENDEIFIGKRKFTVDNFDLFYTALGNDKFNLKVNITPVASTRRYIATSKPSKSPSHINHNTIK